VRALSDDDDVDDLLMIEDDEDVVMETRDAVSRKRKAIEPLDDTASGDFVAAKKLCTLDSTHQTNAVD